MKQAIFILVAGLFLTGCAAHHKPTIVAFRPLAVRIPSECRTNSKPFIKLRESGPYSLSDLARDWQRGRRLYMSEAARADRCRLWVKRIHQTKRRNHD